MGFKQRLGSALTNIKDIQMYGYPKNQDQELKSEHHDEKNVKHSLNVDENDSQNNDIYPGWEIKFTQGEPK